jgi:hypothetical protein
LRGGVTIELRFGGAHALNVRVVKAVRFPLSGRRSRRVINPLKETHTQFLKNLLGLLCFAFKE